MSSIENSHLLALKGTITIKRHEFFKPWISTTKDYDHDSNALFDARRWSSRCPRTAKTSRWSTWGMARRAPPRSRPFGRSHGRRGLCRKRPRSRGWSARRFMSGMEREFPLSVVALFVTRRLLRSTFLAFCQMKWNVAYESEERWLIGMGFLLLCYIIYIYFYLFFWYCLVVFFGSCVLLVLILLLFSFVFGLFFCRRPWLGGVPSPFVTPIALVLVQYIEI